MHLCEFLCAVGTSSCLDVCKIDFEPDFVDDAPLQGRVSSDLKLKVVQVAVYTTGLEQLFVGAILDNLSILHH